MRDIQSVIFIIICNKLVLYIYYMLTTDQEIISQKKKNHFRFENNNILSKPFFLSLSCRFSNFFFF